MSFFPAPDFEKMNAASMMFTSSHPLVATPPDSSRPDRSSDSFFVTSPPTSDGLMPTVHPSCLSSEEPRGLGLMPYPSPQQSSMPYHMSMSTSQPMPMVYTWTPDYLAQNPEQHYQGLRRDSCTWSDNCDPMSTILSSGTAWHGLPNPSAPSTSCEEPPSLSPYSNHSSPSAVSSTYSRPEEYMRQRAASSPMIKIEDNVDSSGRSLHHVRESRPLEQSLLVRPRDLETRATTADMLVGDYMSPGMDDDNDSDYKPSLSIDGTPSGVDYKPHLRPTHPSSSRRYRDSKHMDDSRQKRTYTNEDNACCACDQCGKLFQRTYNLRAHMETHDPNRRHPHLCHYQDCNKRFVRRTDLTRHQQSVHIKSRDFVCHDCEATFARKDTLARHCDDGCPKRVEYKMRPPRSRRPSKTMRRQSVAAPSPLRHAEQFP